MAVGGLIQPSNSVFLTGVVFYWHWLISCVSPMVGLEESLSTLFLLGFVQWIKIQDGIWASLSDGIWYQVVDRSQSRGTPIHCFCTTVLDKFHILQCLSHCAEGSWDLVAFLRWSYLQLYRWGLLCHEEVIEASSAMYRLLGPSDSNWNQCHHTHSTTGHCTCAFD